MIIKKDEFNAIKRALISLYFNARDLDDQYVMYETDMILAYLQSIENRDIRNRQSLK